MKWSIAIARRLNRDIKFAILLKDTTHTWIQADSKRDWGSGSREKDGLLKRPLMTCMNTLTETRISEAARLMITFVWDVLEICEVAMMETMLNKSARTHNTNVTIISGRFKLSFSCSLSNACIKEELNWERLYLERFVHSRTTYLKLLPLYATRPSSHNQSNRPSMGFV